MQIADRLNLLLDSYGHILLIAYDIRIEIALTGRWNARQMVQNRKV